jgi:hypothetical protein
MSRHVDELTLSGAMTLLSYLQYSQQCSDSVDVVAVAATLCEMLSQLEHELPGVAKAYGWEKVMPSIEAQTAMGVYLDSDRVIR